MRKSHFSKDLIAPCGLNCGLCQAHLRLKNPCPGCRRIGPEHPKTRRECQLRLCTKRSSSFCHDCPEFPCNGLKRLDKRYRQRYGISVIQNLRLLRDQGIRAFLKREQERWVSARGIRCMHTRKYFKPNDD